MEGKNNVVCPKCFGAVDTMEGNTLEKDGTDKGFKYKSCNLCKGKGEVSEQLADDYIFSLNEENFGYEEEDDWL